MKVKVDLKTLVEMQKDSMDLFRLKFWFMSIPSVKLPENLNDGIKDLFNQKENKIKWLEEKYLSANETIKQLQKELEQMREFYIINQPYIKNVIREVEIPNPKPSKVTKGEL